MRTLNKEQQEMMSPQEALEILKSGNERFVNNLKVNRNLLQQVNETREGQWPFAAIVSCMDSRTSAELIFDQGLGDIFSIRIAGNIINDDILGSLEFATKVVGCKLIMVLGHSKCGAIKGACDHVQLGHLSKLLAKIEPAVQQENETHENRTSGNAAFVENVAEINVRKSIDEVIKSSEIINELVTNGKLGIIGAMYDVATGTVQFYTDSLVLKSAEGAEQKHEELA
jgi:carbonic anhydrase